MVVGFGRQAEMGKRVRTRNENRSLEKKEPLQERNYLVRSAVECLDPDKKSLDGMAGPESKLILRETLDGRSTKRGG